MVTAEEKKNQRIAMITSLGIHAAIFIFFFFMIAWKAPNPPAPEYGIEVNFGTDSEGWGAPQPTEPVGSQGTAEEEPQQPEVQPEETVAETPKSEPVEAEPEVVSKLESPVTVKEEKKEEPKPPVKTPEKVPEKKEEPKPQVNQTTVYKPSTTTSANKTTDAKQGQAGNNGNDPNTQGDKGSPEGSLDPKGAYDGKAGGGGGGYGLKMPGWAWATPPSKKKLTSNFSGYVRFEIEVDEDGQIVKITKLEGTLNLEDERQLREAIEKSQLEKTSAGMAPPKSKGVVEFTLQLE